MFWQNRRCRRECWKRSSDWRPSWARRTAGPPPNRLGSPRMSMPSGIARMKPRSSRPGQWRSGWPQREMIECRVAANCLASPEKERTVEAQMMKKIENRRGRKRARLFFLSSLSSGRRPKLSCDNSVTEEATGDPSCCYRQDVSVADNSADNAAGIGGRLLKFIEMLWPRHRQHNARDLASSDLTA